jgi:hypothetical protein
LARSTPYIQDLTMARHDGRHDPAPIISIQSYGQLKAVIGGGVGDHCLFAEAFS